MSHYSLLLITPHFPADDVIDQAMAPYHEFECTGTESEFVQDIDMTEEARKEYADDTVTRLRDPAGGLHDPYDDEFYRDPTPEEIAEIGPIAGTGFGGGLSYTSKDWGDGRGHRSKGKFIPDGWTEITLPRRETQTFREFINDYYGTKTIEVVTAAAGTVVTVRGTEDFKYGYALAEKGGDIYKVIRRTNPNSKWDWFQVGGRWTGHFAPGYDPDSDPNNKEGCFLCHGTGSRPDGEPGNTCNGCEGRGIRTKWPTQWRSVGNIIQRKDLDVYACREASVVAALKPWRTRRAIVAGLPQARLWSEVRAEFKDDIEAARTAYNTQPAIVALAKSREYFLEDEDIASLYLSEEQVADAARKRALATRAVLKDGVWSERGRTGWWGIVHEEKNIDEWREQFAKLIDEMPGDTWLTIIDCHT